MFSISLFVSSRCISPTWRCSFASFHGAHGRPGCVPLTSRRKMRFLRSTRPTAFNNLAVIDYRQRRRFARRRVARPFARPTATQKRLDSPARSLALTTFRVFSINGTKRCYSKRRFSARRIAIAFLKSREYRAIFSLRRTPSDVVAQFLRQVWLSQPPRAHHPRIQDSIRKDIKTYVAPLSTRSNHTSYLEKSCVTRSRFRKTVNSILLHGPALFGGNTSPFSKKNEISSEFAYVVSYQQHQSELIRWKDNWMEYKESIYIYIDKKDIIKCEKNKLAKLSDYNMLDDTDSDRIKLVILNERLSIFKDCEI